MEKMAAGEKNEIVWAEFFQTNWTTFVEESTLLGVDFDCFKLLVSKRGWWRLYKTELLSKCELLIIKFALIGNRLGFENSRCGNAWFGNI